jgi:hypothetical protein
MASAAKDSQPNAAFRDAGDRLGQLLWGLGAGLGDRKTLTGEHEAIAGATLSCDGRPRP